jgi:hypothetical protein
MRDFSKDIAEIGVTYLRDLSPVESGEPDAG